MCVAHIASSSAVKIDALSVIRFENSKNGQIKAAAVLSPSFDPSVILILGCVQYPIALYTTVLQNHTQYNHNKVFLSNQSSV